MPELPEVETTKRGIAPYLLGHYINLRVRNHRLRWPIPKELSKILQGQKITDISRRGKYILLEVEAGTVILHLGMSGSFRVTTNHEAPGKHDHFDLTNSDQQTVRYNDPRKFGCLLFHPKNKGNHPLLASLGVEPLQPDFSGEFLYKNSQSHHVAIKPLLMNSKIVVGIGNIYASEALFLAKIHPARASNKIAKPGINNLVDQIQFVLNRAIHTGGTTLKDFTQPNGSPGYFEQELAVYGRQGLPCIRCNSEIKRIIQGKRSTFFCAKCQK